MLQTHQQKRYFFIALLGIVVLVLVTVTSHPGGFNSALDGAQKEVATDNVANKAAYDAAQAASDKLATEKLLKQLIPYADAKKDVEDLLQVNQKTVVPEIPASQIKIASANDKNAVVAYLTKAGEQAQNFSAAITAQAGTFDDPTVAAQAATLVAGYQQQLASLPVPRAAVGLHTSELIAMQEATQALQLPKDYSLDDVDQAWPSKMYGSYAVANAQLQVAQQEMDGLIKKYAITQDDLQHYADSSSGPAPSRGFSLIHTADAQVGGIIVAINWTEVIRYALEDVWSSLISKFLLGYIDRTVLRIEKNFIIANTLHYTDALIAAQYAPDYIDKYITSSDPGSSADLDRKIIKMLVPQIGCGQNAEEIDKIYQQQVRQYLGYDPTTLSIKDPDFELKAAKSQEFMATKNGRQMYYNGQAQAAGARANQSAILELTGGGSKSARDPQGKQIISTQTKINNTIHSLVQSALDLGTGDTKSVAAKIAASGLGLLVNNFVFNGTLLQEQSTCSSLINLYQIAADGSQGSLTVKKQVRLAAKEGTQAGPWSNSIDVPGSAAGATKYTDVEYKISVSASNGKTFTNVKLLDAPSFGLTFTQCEDGTTSTIAGKPSSLSPDSGSIVIPSVGSSPVDITYCARAGGPSGGQIQNFAILTTADKDDSPADSTINLK